MAVVVNQLLIGVFTDETYKFCSVDHDSPDGCDVYLITIHPIEVQLPCFGRVGWSHPVGALEIHDRREVQSHSRRHHRTIRCQGVIGVWSGSSAGLYRMSAAQPHVFFRSA